MAARLRRRPPRVAAADAGPSTARIAVSPATQARAAPLDRPGDRRGRARGRGRGSRVGDGPRSRGGPSPGPGGPARARGDRDEEDPQGERAGVPRPERLGRLHAGRGAVVLPRVHGAHAGPVGAPVRRESELEPRGDRRRPPRGQHHLGPSPRGGRSTLGPRGADGLLSPDRPRLVDHRGLRRLPPPHRPGVGSPEPRAGPGGLRHLQPRRCRPLPRRPEGRGGSEGRRGRRRPGSRSRS